MTKSYLLIESTSESSYELLKKKNGNLLSQSLKNIRYQRFFLQSKRFKTGAYEIIDGLQRLHAIVSFIETAFPALDQKYFDLDRFPTAKTYLDEGRFDNLSDGNNICSKKVFTILDYSISFFIMRNATEDEINDVFDRINTYGHCLSDQERRQAGCSKRFFDHGS